jgi:glycosyltransferase involved in cell wall biosynthesis
MSIGETGHIDPLSCVFVGALYYRANIDGVTWFCREVWPQLCSRFPGAKFVLVGRRPVASVRRLARDPSVEIAGDVLDVRSYLRNASVVAVPLRIARGIQNKVLEALAVGKAVIASPQALEGLEVVAGQHVCQASTAEEWLNGISRLFRDDAERRRLGAAGRLFVLNHHQWDQCLQPFAELLGLSSVNQSVASAVTARLAVQAR